MKKFQEIGDDGHSFNSNLTFAQNKTHLLYEQHKIVNQSIHL